MTRAAFALSVTAAALAAVSCAALGQPRYPSRPVHLVAPFAPGELGDVLARALAEKLKPPLGQAVIVDNHPGADGNTGAALVARAGPDGYTLLMSPGAVLAINQFLYPRLPFDAASGFTPVILVADLPLLLVINGKLPAQSVAEFIAYAKKPGTRVSFGSPGTGTMGHLGMELLQAAAGIKLTHVAYKSTAEAVTSVVGGQVQCAMVQPPVVLQQVRAGALKVVAMAAPARLQLLPDVPTLSEAGLKGVEASLWFGVVAPAKTPRDIVVRLNREIAQALRNPETVQRFTALGARISPGSPEDFADHIESERARWETVVLGAKIKVQQDVPARASGKKSAK